jgi:hypothetical protein
VQVHLGHFSSFPSRAHRLSERLLDARLRLNLFATLRHPDSYRLSLSVIGQRAVTEFEQGGAGRAEYGKRLLPTLAETLTAEFGNGFDASNLRYMRLFYQAFPIRDALRHELSWNHYCILLRVENDQARQWYMNETATQGWTTRALERQMSTLYYERLLASSDRIAVEQEAATNLAPLQQSPREFVRDPGMLEFLGLPGTGKLLAADLEQALLDRLREKIPSSSAI